MEKIVDGLELLRMIRDGEIKNGTKIKDDSGDIYVVTETKDRIVRKDIGSPMLEDFLLDNFMYEKFEILLEEDEEIDIDSIEELNLFDNGKGFDSKIDVRQFYDSNFEKISNGYKEMLRAIKQLNKKVKELGWLDE